MPLQLSELCEEFGCLPSVLEAELERTPIGLLWDIVAHRRYARLKAEYDSLSAAGDKRVSDKRFREVARMEIRLMKERYGIQ